LSPGSNTIEVVIGINLRDNVYGPLLLAEICRKFCIHFTYIRSGCLFKYFDEQWAPDRQQSIYWLRGLQWIDCCRPGGSQTASCSITQMFSMC